MCRTQFHLFACGFNTQVAILGAFLAPPARTSQICQLFITWDGCRQRRVIDITIRPNVTFPNSAQELREGISFGSQTCETASPRGLPPTTRQHQNLHTEKPVALAPLAIIICRRAIFIRPQTM